MNRGFALTEALVALLLLAISLLGAASSLTQSLVATRAAQWQATATDLAGDLAEQLHDAPLTDRPAQLASWQARAAVALPLDRTGAQLQARLVELARDDDELPASHAVQLAWRDPQFRQAQQLELPLLLAGP